MRTPKQEKTMTQTEAIALLLEGRKVRRKSWRGGCHVETSPYSKFFVLTSNRGSKPWSPYVEDFKADDWIEVQE